MSKSIVAEIPWPGAEWSDERRCYVVSEHDKSARDALAKHWRSLRSEDPKATRQLWAWRRRRLAKAVEQYWALQLQGGNAIGGLQHILTE